MRKDIDLRKKEIIEWIAKGWANTMIAEKIKCKTDTLLNRYKKWGVVYKGNQGKRGYKSSPYKKSALEYLKSSCITTYKLKIKLFEDKIKEKKCEICGITKWNGNEAPLELHHKDGNRFNNNLNNLEILCPNCHSLTKNFSAKNINNYS
jgi:hypothetical protein